jgi:hypothetical protein
MTHRPTDWPKLRNKPATFRHEAVELEGIVRAETVGLVLVETDGTHYKWYRKKDLEFVK